MTEFAKMDVFFFITTIAIVVLGALLAILIIYLIKIVADVKEISTTVKLEAKNLSEDIGDLRDSVRTEGFKLKTAAKFFNAIYKHKKRKHDRSKNESSQ